MPGNDAPTIRPCPPNASVSERPRKGCTFERPGHLHANAHDADVPNALDVLLTWLETRDADQAAPVRVQIVLLSVDRAVWPDENKLVVQEPVELLDIAGELSLAKRFLAVLQ